MKVIAAAAMAADVRIGMRVASLAVAILLCAVSAAPAPSKAATPQLARNRWGDERAGAMIDRGLAAIAAHHIAAAERESTALEAAYLDEPASLVVAQALAVEANDGAGASDLLIRMIIGRPDRLSSPIGLIDPHDVQRTIWISDGLDEVRLARTMRALAKGGGPVSDAYDPKWAQQILIDHDIDQNDIPAASDVLADVNDPFVLEQLLIRDRYAPLHAAIVARWSGDLEAAVSHAAQPLPDTQLKEPPLRAGADRARVLVAAGRYADALVATLPNVDAAIQGGSLLTDRLDLLIYAAQALSLQGRSAEGLAIYTRLDGMGRRSNGAFQLALASEARLLGDLGRPREALALSRSLDSEAKGSSLWTRAVIKRLEVCAAADVGDMATAKSEVDALLRLDAQPAFTVEALICIGDLDRAAAVIAGSFARNDGDRVLANLQITRGSVPGIWTERWSKGFAALRSRSDVAKAVAGYGQITQIALRFQEVY